MNLNIQYYKCAGFSKSFASSLAYIFTAILLLAGISAGAQIHPLVSGGAPPEPGAITGPTTVSAGGSSTYSISAVTGATSYRWTLSNTSAGTISNPAVTANVTWSSTFSGSVTVYVYAINSSGSSPARGLAVNVLAPPLVSGTISPSTQTVNYNSSPSFTATAPTGGSGGYTYQWQYSTNQTTWNNVAGATTLTPALSAITTTTYYQLISYSGSGSVTSNMATVTVFPQVIAGTASPASQTVFAGAAVGQLSSTAASGGNLSYTYQWLNSTDGSTFSPISGATSLTYNPGIANMTMYYRLYVNSNNATTYGNICTVTVSDCPTLGTTPTTNANYTTTTTFLEAGITSTSASQIAAMGVCNANQTIEYLDDMGRSVQTVGVKANANAGGDMIIPTYYDAYGRESMVYLPYADATSPAGSYRSNALQAGAGQAAYFASPPAGVVQSNAPYAQTNYEPSPLDRAIEQGGTGADWQPSTGHTVKTVYSVNGTNDVQQYEVESGTTPGQEYICTLSNLGYYQPGDLFVTTIENENWTSASGQVGTVADYKDKNGRLILRRAYTTGPVAYSTYYVYDYRGNLSYILTPAYNPDNGTVNQTLLNNLCYQYHFDGRGRMIEQKLPGKGWEYVVYNSHDQVVMFQDPNLLTNGQWQFLKYDQLGRSIIAGIAASANTRVQQQTAVSSQTGYGETQNNSGGTGYTNTTYPTSGISYNLWVNYYDNYSWPNASTLPAQNGYQATLFNKVTGSLVYTVDGASSYLTANYYDIEGHMTEIVGQNCMNGTDHVINTYDFVGKVLNTNRTHVGNNQTTTINISYIYDQAGRDRQEWVQVNGGTNVLLSQYDYNDLGQLYVKHLHSTNNGASFLQNLTYSYNERGWLVGENAGTGGLLNLTLKYDLPDAGITPQYNGNVVEMTYYDDYNNVNKTNSYAYDPLDRLVAAQTAGNALNETVTYDSMGNIVTLVRGGAQGASLAYSYTDKNGNLSTQLSSVTKSGTPWRSYNYDPNGNAQSNGAITAPYGITYNLLDLPKTVTSGSTTIASYVYDANGQKLKNTGSDGTWAYDSGIVYGNYSSTSSPSFIQTDEGRIYRNPSGTFDYQYDLTDHLGNVRSTFDAGTSGTASLIQEDDYYPFGLRTGVFDASNSNNRFLFSGKEVQTDLANQYDYGARFYDPVIAKWTTTDPLAESSADAGPFNYAANNPLTNIDPNGMDWVRQGSQWVYKDDITTAQQARDAGFTGFLKNGSILKNATINGEGSGSVFLGYNAYDVQYINGIPLNSVTINGNRSDGPGGNLGMTALAPDGASSSSAAASTPSGSTGGQTNPVNHGFFGLENLPDHAYDYCFTNKEVNDAAWTELSFILPEFGGEFVGSALRFTGKGIVSLAARFALRQAVENPILTQAEERAMINIPKVASMMEGKGIDRAFRMFGEKNIILRAASKLDLIEFNPVNRGADMIGKGFFDGTWWDVTTEGAWNAHVTKYGPGGIPLLY